MKESVYLMVAKKQRERKGLGAKTSIKGMPQ
jgi:hypothetical protein